MFSLPFSPSTFRLDNGRNYLLVIRSPLCWKTSPSCSSLHSIHKSGSLTQKIHRCKLCPLLRRRKKIAVHLKVWKEKFALTRLEKDKIISFWWMSLWLDLVHWIRRRQNEKRYFNFTKWFILWHNRKKKTKLVAFLISFFFSGPPVFLKSFEKKREAEEFEDFRAWLVLIRRKWQEKKQFLKMDPDPEGKKEFLFWPRKGKWFCRKLV